MADKSLISALRDANAEKDRFIDSLVEELVEEREKVKRLQRYIEFLKLRGGE